MVDEQKIRKIINNRLLYLGLIDESCNPVTGDFAAGTNTEIQFNSAGALAGSPNLTWSGTVLGITGNATVTDEAYGVGWNGSTQVPTKNAIYDKIQTLGSGDILNGGNTTGAPILIGSNDAYALNLETSGVPRLSITGAAATGGAVTLFNTAAANNTIEYVLSLNTTPTASGAGNNGFGAGLIFRQKSATTDDQFSGRIETPWTTAAHASRTSDMVFRHTVSGVNTEAMRLVGAATPVLTIAGGTTTYGNAAITTGSGFTLGNSAQLLTLGGSSGQLLISCSNATAGATIGISATSNTATAAGNILIGPGTGINFTQTSGTRDYVNIAYNFTPASGTAVHNRLSFTGTLNQTGGANGIIRGINFAHTMTSVADYRAIEIADNLGNSKGIYQTGDLTTNNFVGKTRFGKVSAPTAQLQIDQTATALGALTGIVYTGAVNTNQTLSTEIPAVTITTAGRQWATGALTTQREFLITQPTYSFVGASTITNAATFAVAGAPIQSTNATHTNSHAILVQAGAVTGAGSSYGLTVNAQTGGTANYAAQLMGGNVGIGVAAPTAKVHIAAGSTAASSSPLKFVSGALMTSAEVGAVEFLTDSLYVTTTTGTRRRMIIAGSVGRANGQVAANTSVSTFTTQAVDGTYEISANVLVTTSSAQAFSVTVAYTDEGNTARTQTLVFSLLAGTTTNLIASANGAVPYAGVPSHIRCRASTAITIATSGTFTGCTYNVEGVIKQIA